MHPWSPEVTKRDARPPRARQNRRDGQDRQPPTPARMRGDRRSHGVCCGRAESRATRVSTDPNARVPREPAVPPPGTSPRGRSACPETSGTTLRAAALLLQAAQVPAGKGRENKPWHLRVVGQDSVTKRDKPLTHTAQVSPRNAHWTEKRTATSH